MLCDDVVAECVGFPGESPGDIELRGLSGRMMPESSIRRVKMVQVVDLLGVSHAPDVIRTYVEAMRVGQSFPPISVVPFGRRFIITDGHKRFNACRVLGLEEIEVEVWTYSRLVGDLGRQLNQHLRAAGTSVLKITRGPEGRREAFGFVAVTVAHWRRMAVSLWSLLRRRAG